MILESLVAKAVTEPKLIRDLVVETLSKFYYLLLTLWQEETNGDAPVALSKEGNIFPSQPYP